MSTNQVIRWWELRRIPYNAALLVIGGASIFGMEWLVSRVIPLGEDAVEPLALIAGVLLYGFIANLFYTLGWVVELFGRSNPELARKRGQWLFRAGMIFACLLTTLPFWFGLAYWFLNRAHYHSAA